jgi:hypothetical protein
MFTEKGDQLPGQVQMGPTFSVGSSASDSGRREGRHIPGQVQMGNCLDGSFAHTRCWAPIVAAASIDHSLDWPSRESALRNLDASEFAFLQPLPRFSLIGILHHDGQQTCHSCERLENGPGESRKQKISHRSYSLNSMHPFCG